jgi:hypothetical protein
VKLVVILAEFLELPSAWISHWVLRDRPDETLGYDDKLSISKV